MANPFSKIIGSIRKAFRGQSLLLLRSSLSQGQPGGWANDHAEEANHFTGWNYVAIHRIACTAMASKVEVFLDAEAATLAKARRGSPVLAKRLAQHWKTVGRDDGDAQPLPATHPLAKILQRPNPKQSGASFRYEQVQQLQLTGTCLVWNVPNRLGKTVERYVVPTAVAQPVEPSQQYPSGGYRVQPQDLARGDAQGYVSMAGYLRVVNNIIPAEQMQIIRWPHPLVKDDGYSALAAGALWIDTAEQVDRSRWSHLKNGPEPSVVVRLPEKVDADTDDIARYAQKFNEKYAGVENAGKAIVTNHGTELTPLGQTPRDMNYGEGWTQARDAVLALHGVPGIAAGIMDAGGSWSAVVASLRQFYMTVAPILSLIADEETEQLAPQFGAGLVVSITPPDIDDHETLERQLQTDIAAGAIEVNELRALRGRDAKPYGDVPAKASTPEFGGGGFGGALGAGHAGAGSMGTSNGNGFAELFGESAQPPSAAAKNRLAKLNGRAAIGNGASANGHAKNGHAASNENPWSEYP